GDDIFVHFSNIDSHHRFKLLKQDADVVFELDRKSCRVFACRLCRMLECCCAFSCQRAGY
ncbi:MAG: cold shock domain-containing protein, partial [Chlorobiaceae bacterium]|nr:cold shock domain-containing protein [Chlorobiaceae bacterium]